MNYQHPEDPHRCGSRAVELNTPVEFTRSATPEVQIDDNKQVKRDVTWEMGLVLAAIWATRSCSTILCPVIDVPLARVWYHIVIVCRWYISTKAIAFSLAPRPGFLLPPCVCSTIWLFPGGIVVDGSSTTPVTSVDSFCPAHDGYANEEAIGKARVLRI